MLTHKNLECQQTVEQLEAHFQALINEKGGQVGLPQTSSKRWIGKGLKLEGQR
jgi:hypothetical protein